MAEEKTAVKEKETKKTETTVGEKAEKVVAEAKSEEVKAEQPKAEQSETEKKENAEQKEEPQPVKATEEKPREKPQEKPQENSAKEEKKGEEVKPTTAEPTPVVSVYKTATATYTDAQALNFLRKKIYGYQEIDEDFLKKVAEDGAFKTEMKYISVVRCNADVRYTWETATKEGEKHAHKEEKALSKEFCDDVIELNPFDFGTAKTIDLDKPKEDGKLLAKKSYSVAKAKKDFNAVIKQATPNKKAKAEKITERYETVYVPVLKTSCVFEGETYLGYVNLLNGACVSEYRVSARLQEAVNSTITKVKSVKGALMHSLVFLLLLCVMSLGKAVYHGMDALNVPVLWTGVIMGAAAIVPILCLGVTAKYKPEKMKETAVHTGKMPTAKNAKWLVFISWLICLAAVVVFFLKTVL